MHESLKFVNKLVFTPCNWLNRMFELRSPVALIIINFFSNLPDSSFIRIRIWWLLIRPLCLHFKCVAVY